MARSEANTLWVKKKESSITVRCRSSIVLSFIHTIEGLSRKKIHRELIIGHDPIKLLTVVLIIVFITKLRCVSL
jgi:hypothetical protein